MKSLTTRKECAILKIKKAVDLEEPEERMFFATIEQAIWDIDDSDDRIRSNEDWAKGHLAPICDTIGLDHAFVLRILNEQDLL